MDTERAQAFHTELDKQLRAAITAHPDRYGNPTAEQINERVKRLYQAAESGYADKSGLAMQGTMKALGIRNSYAALAAYFRGE